MNAHPHRLFGRKRLRLAVIAMTPALALTLFALPSATPAYAYSCGGGYLCTWQNSFEGGTQWNFHVTSGQPGTYWWYVGNTPNDQISSIHNSTVSKGWFNKDCLAGSQYTWVGSGASANNLANNLWPNGTSMNDSISAWAISTNYPAHGSRTAGGC